MGKHAVTLTAPADSWREKPLMVFARRHTVAEQMGPLSPCVGCGRPTKSASCRAPACVAKVTQP